MANWWCAPIAAGLLLTPSASVAQWAYSTSADAMTDKPSARAFIRGQGGRIGIKCDDPGANSLYVHVISDQYLGGEGGRADLRTGTLRFDADAPEENSWYFDDSSAILAEAVHVWPVIDRLRRAKKLAWRGMSYDGRQVTITFDVPPDSGEIDRVVAICQATRP